ncbi:hypothetical protein, partial [Chryseobacterium sp. CH1]|uniref:hypothetical protein n=1 Tax=Chryseobacterium sp. CH1 TaxID=713551 RepID=UPI001623A8A3
DILAETVTKHCAGKTDVEIFDSTFADIACGSGEQLKIKDSEITLEKKPENIDRDIVTTPTFIIRDILAETVTKHCAGKTDVEIFDSTFADIACGSG